MKRQIILMLLAVFVTITLTGCSDSKKKQQAAAPPEPPPLDVEMIVAKEEPVPIWLEYTGKTEASRRIEVRARVAGILEKVLFTEGAFVEKGQKLFEIEKNTYEQALEQARAKREMDQATLDLALADVKRYEPLVEEGLAPRATLEQYMARRNELIAVVRADEAAIRDAELNLSYTDVLAPISGNISRMFVDVGNIVGFGENTVLTTMVSNDPMYAYFNPTEEDFQIMRQYGFKDKLDAIVRLPGGGQSENLKRGPYKGQVNFSDNRVNSMTGTITMRATVDNPDLDLLEGTFVYVEVFVSDKYSLILVPPQVVLEDQRGSFLYVVDENNRVNRVDVQRGYEGRYFLYIKEGLEDGDKVVVSSLQTIRQDMKVTPTDVTAEKGVMAVFKKHQMAEDKE
jgi:RND family efflux transporter MFP subunit